jgi:DNA-directed RNA polymerase subunit RPC12/RpoP
MYNLYKCDTCKAKWTFGHGWVAGYLIKLLLDNPCRVCGSTAGISHMGMTRDRV